MTNVPEVKKFIQKVNDLEMYCELRGKGPTIVLVPAGEGDCTSFGKVADTLADEFTVLTFDMRGMSRTSNPSDWKETPPRLLADDIYGIVNALDLGPASFYGCSSGGQAVLTLGIDHPEICRNLMVHEAALLLHAPLSGPGTPDNGLAPAFMKKMTQMMQKISADMKPIEVGYALCGQEMEFNKEAWEVLPPEYFERIGKNIHIHREKYLGTCDTRWYSDQELSNLPPLVISVGFYSPAWMVEANRRLAEKADAEVVWLPCMHLPQVPIPDLLAKHIRKNTHKHICALN